MNNYRRKLDKLIDSGKEISVAVIGTGFMGEALVSQLNFLKGVSPRILINRNAEKAKNVALKSNIHESDLVFSPKDFNINKNFLVSDDIDFALENEQIDVIVDATGSPEMGAIVGSKAIENNKDIVTFNVEADSTIGLLLSKKAKEKDLIYTGIYGDEPGAIKELYDFSELIGLEVIAVGKGKNNPLDHSANPDSLKEKANKSGLNPNMLVTFVDGTNTMNELCSVGNSIGFKPDITGCHGITSDIKQLADKIKLKSEGGILNSYKVLDFVFGIAPGVFAVVKTENKEMDFQMKFLKMGDGPNYVLYRPYHLTGMEAPISIFKAYFDREESICSTTQSSDVAAVAKIDMNVGDHFDSIGGYTVYGLLEEVNNFRNNKHIPATLINEKCYARKKISKGEFLTTDNTFVNDTSMIYKLRKEQDNLLWI